MDYTKTLAAAGGAEMLKEALIDAILQVQQTVNHSLLQDSSRQNTALFVNYTNWQPFSSFFVEQSLWIGHVHRGIFFNDCWPG